jgi:hypothetical protein
MTQKQGGREVSDAAIRTYVLQQQVAATFGGQFGTCSRNDRGLGEIPISSLQWRWTLMVPGSAHRKSVKYFEIRIVGHDKDEVLIMNPMGRLCSIF